MEAWVSDSVGDNHSSDLSDLSVPEVWVPG